MRVLAVTPTYGDTMRPEMRASMEALDLEGIDLTWMVIDEQPYPAPDHRNVLHMYRKARERALRGRYDVMWTVENDMVLPQDAAQHLNATPGDVVYGVYIIRFGTEVLSAFQYVDNANVGDSFTLSQEALSEALKHTVVRCSGTGWGCTWIRRDALKTIRFPEEWPENPPFDIAFSHLCLRKGLVLNANFRVQCGHIKNGQALWPMQYEKPVEYSPYTWLIDGQVIPQYRAKISVPEPAAQGPARAGAPESGRKPALQEPQRMVSNFIRIVATQDVTVRVGVESQRLKAGQQYDLPAQDAREIVRGGYAQEATFVVP